MGFLLPVGFLVSPAYARQLHFLSEVFFIPHLLPLHFPGLPACKALQSCMSFTEKIVVAKISAKVMNSFKVMQFIYKMKSSVKALFSVNLMYSVNFRSLVKKFNFLIFRWDRIWQNHPDPSVLVRGWLHQGRRRWEFEDRLHTGMATKHNFLCCLFKCLNVNSPIRRSSYTSCIVSVSPTPWTRLQRSHTQNS